ncbi:MAG TPA: glycosyltransferase [Planctomycetota bacterium]|nr:glycosyltransferase [Planctomycetota bacterium]
MDLTLLVTTFERPYHLERLFGALLRQRIPPSLDPRRVQLLIADDGSQDHTPAVIARYARLLPFQVETVTGTHQGYRPSVARNRALPCIKGEYLVGTDGDCLPHRDFLARHWEQREQGRFLLGDAIRLDAAASQSIGVPEVHSGIFETFGTDGDWNRWRRYMLRLRSFVDRGLYWRSELRGLNWSAYTADVLRVNGFDERYHCHFVGWGGEDTDLGLRLSLLGLRAKVCEGALTTHLYHAPEDRGSEANRLAKVRYLRRSWPLVQCRQGCRNRGLRELTFGLSRAPADYGRWGRLITQAAEHDRFRLVLPGGGASAGSTGGSDGFSDRLSANAGNLRPDALLSLDDEPFLDRLFAPPDTATRIALLFPGKPTLRRRLSRFQLPGTTYCLCPPAPGAAALREGPLAADAAVQLLAPADGGLALASYLAGRDDHLDRAVDSVAEAFEGVF